MNFIRKKADYKECAKKWLAIKAGTHLFCIVFSKETNKTFWGWGGSMFYVMYWAQLRMSIGGVCKLKLEPVKGWIMKSKNIV